VTVIAQKRVFTKKITYKIIILTTNRDS